MGQHERRPLNENHRCINGRLCESMNKWDKLKIHSNDLPHSNHSNSILVIKHSTTHIQR